MITVLLLFAFKSTVKLFKGSTSEVNTETPSTQRNVNVLCPPTSLWVLGVVLGEVGWHLTTGHTSGPTHLATSPSRVAHLTRHGWGHHLLVKSCWKNKHTHNWQCHGHGKGKQTHPSLTVPWTETNTPITGSAVAMGQRKTNTHHWQCRGHGTGKDKHTHHWQCRGHGTRTNKHTHHWQCRGHGTRTNTPITDSAVAMGQGQTNLPITDSAVAMGQRNAKAQFWNSAPVIIFLFWDGGGRW